MEVITFDSGATRSAESTFDLEGFVNPRVMLEFGLYMERHRYQKDGNLRASDNWQKGMPSDRIMRSLSRHYLDLWLLQRGYKARSEDCSSKMDALCAILFNTMALMKNELDQGGSVDSDSTGYKEDVADQIRESEILDRASRLEHKKVSTQGLEAGTHPRLSNWDEDYIARVRGGIVPGGRK